MDDRRLSNGCAARCRCLCDLKPSGRFLAIDLHRAGGIPQVMRTLLAAGLLHADCMTITGKTVAENLADIPDVPARRPGRDPHHRQPDVRRGPPGHPQGQPVARRLRGEDHRPEEPGHHRPGARGSTTSNRPWLRSWPAKSSPGDVMVLRYLGPKGAPGMPEMLAPTGALIGQGLGRVAWV